MTNDRKSEIEGAMNRSLSLAYGAFCELRARDCHADEKACHPQIRLARAIPKEQADAFRAQFCKALAAKPRLELFGALWLLFEAQGKDAETYHLTFPAIAAAAVANGRIVPRSPFTNRTWQDEGKAPDLRWTLSASEIDAWARDKFDIDLPAFRQSLIEPPEPGLPETNQPVGQKAEKNLLKALGLAAISIAVMSGGRFRHGNRVNASNIAAQIESILNHLNSTGHEIQRQGLTQSALRDKISDAMKEMAVGDLDWEALKEALRPKE